MITAPFEFLQHVNGFIAYTIAQDPIEAIGYGMCLVSMLIMLIVVHQLHKIHKKEGSCETWQ